MRTTTAILILILAGFLVQLPAHAGPEDLYNELYRYVQWDEPASVKQFLASHKKNAASVLKHENGAILMGACGLVRDPAIVKMLLAAGADPNVARKGNDGYTPLHCAIAEYTPDTKARVTEIVKLLVAKGANVNTPDEEGLTPLSLACKKEVVAKDLVAALLAARTVSVDVPAKVIESNENSGWTALFYAVTRPSDPTGTNLEIVKMLLARKPDMALTSPRKQTALHHLAAAKMDRADLALALIDAGADVNARDESDATPLLFALRANHPEICRVLLQKGADRTIVGGHFGYSPIQRAEAVMQQVNAGQFHAEAEAARVIVEFK